MSFAMTEVPPHVHMMAFARSPYVSQEFALLPLADDITKDTGSHDISAIEKGDSDVNNLVNHPVASGGDWIIGFRSCMPGYVVYVMQVAQSMPLDAYWDDTRFYDRRPDAASPVPDNIYRPYGNGDLEWGQNNIHNFDEKPRDISGHNVLIGSRFWYFGSTNPILPQSLEHLVPYPRGHTVHKNRRPDDVENLERWLGSWPCGIHGLPINASSELKD